MSSDVSTPSSSAAAPPTVLGTLKPQTLPSGLVLRFEAPSASSRDQPITIGTPPGTPVHMAMKGGGEGSGSIKGSGGAGAGASSSSSSSSAAAATGGSPYFRSLAAGTGVGAGPSAGGRPSPLLPPLGLPPTRNDTDEDLMQKQVQWEIEREEIEWENSQKLGAGAFGEVIRAKWRGTPVAVKKVNVGGTGAVRELRHEIAVMSHMHHPRVVQFLGACTRSQPWLVIFEYMPGGALSTLLEKRQGRFLPFKVAGRFALDCAQGLRYLHEHKPTGVVHRDLKPNNLVIDASGHCKITDFGLAKVVDIIKAQTDTYVMTGETGSYRYMAPEVFRHEKYSEKVDIYAFAMILYYLTHGEPPFAWLPPVEAAQAAALRHLRPEVRPSLNRDLSALIERCWQPDPSARPTAREVCSILEKLFPDTDDAMDVLGEGCSCSVV